MKKVIIIIILALSGWGISHAQQDATVDQYMFNGLYLNPAYAGSHEYMTTTLIVRKQWAQFEGAPFSQFLSLEGMVGRNVGLGLLVSNDRIGVTNQTNFITNYAYHIKAGRKGKLSLGVDAGLTLYNAKLSDLIYWDQNDGVFENNIRNKPIAIVGTGAYYYTDRFFMGFSVPNLINYDPSYRLSIDKGNIPHLVNHYYFTTGYAIKISEMLDLKPSVLFKFTKNAPLNVDINLNALIAKKFWIGASYRTNKGIVGMMDFLIKDLMRVGYAYTYPLNEINNYTSGTHEVMLGFDILKKEEKVKSPRYF